MKDNLHSRALSKKSLNNILNIIIQEPNTDSNIDIETENISDETNLTNELISANTSTAMMPGARINNKRGNFTFGVWVNRVISGQTFLGFVTCGHPFFKEVNNTYYKDEFLKEYAIVYAGTSTTEIGNTSAVNAYIGDANQNTNKYDYAFVLRSNPNYLPTTSMFIGGTIKSTYMGLYPENTQLYIAGGKNGMSYGNSSYSYFDSSFITEGYVINLDYGIVTDGDSGAPVYHIRNGQKILAGFQSKKNGDAACFYTPKCNNLYRLK